MRKLVVFVLLVTTLSVFNSTSAQSGIETPATESKSKFNPHAFIGTWSSSLTSIRIKFSYDDSGKLQIYLWDTNDGEVLEVLKFETKGDRIYTTERVPSSDFTTKNIYKMKGSNTLVNSILGDESSTITFTRVK